MVVLLVPSREGCVQRIPWKLKEHFEQVLQAEVKVCFLLHEINYFMALLRGTEKSSLSLNNSPKNVSS